MTFESQLEIVAAVMSDKSIPSRSRCRLAELRRRLPADADLDRLNRVWRAMRVAEIYKAGTGAEQPLGASPFFQNRLEKPEDEKGGCNCPLPANVSVV